MKIPVLMEDTHAELIELGVAPAEQTLSIGKPFWVFFTGNIGVSGLLLGALIASFGLGLWPTVAIILLGNAIGTAGVGLIAIMGPRTRLSQVEASRLALGKGGSRLTGALNWLSCIGWDAVNNIPAAAACVALLALGGWHGSYLLCLIGLVLVQMLIGIYGHHLVQVVTKYSGWGMLALMALLAVGLCRHGLTFPLHHSADLKDYIAAISLTVVGTLSSAPFASDYTRYLPAQTASRKIFLTVFMGEYLACILIEGLGMLMMAGLADLTPDSIIAMLSGMAGDYAPLILLAVALMSIPINAANDNSASYCMISAGVRLSRPVSAVFGAIVGLVMAAWGAGRFADAFQNALMFLFYWTAPWLAIVLIHWFRIGRHQAEHQFTRGWTMAATIFIVTTILTIALFSASPLYTSPVAKALGGIDIGFYVGFVIAGLWYAATLKKVS